MIETDYVWMRPLQAPPAQDPASRPLAFPFSYIAPQTPSIEAVMRRMYPPERGPIADVPGTGPAPVLMRFQEWLEVRGTECRQQISLPGACRIRMYQHCRVARLRNKRQALGHGLKRRWCRSGSG